MGDGLSVPFIVSCPDTLTYARFSLSAPDFPSFSRFKCPFICTDVAAVILEAIYKKDRTVGLVFNYAI